MVFFLCVYGFYWLFFLFEDVSTVLPDIYCKLNLSPEWPFRNFHWIPVFLVKCFCVCKLEFLSDNLLLKNPKDQLQYRKHGVYVEMGYRWMWISQWIVCQRQGPNFRNYIPLPKNYDMIMMFYRLFLSIVLYFKQVLRCWSQRRWVRWYSA